MASLAPPAKVSTSLNGVTANKSSSERIQIIDDEKKFTLVAMWISLLSCINRDADLSLRHKSSGGDFVMQALDTIS